MHPLHHHGHTLIEVMIALVIIAVGLLSLGSLHGGLARTADTARQRTEATHLAQAKLEELRGFEQTLAAAGKFAYADLAGGQDLPILTSSTRYERRWRMSAAGDGPRRRVDIEVDWTERSGDARQVQLSSVIAQAEPADEGRLALPVTGDRERQRPWDRALGIPLEAGPLTGELRGRSVLRWAGPTGGYLVFDDASGAVIAQCAVVPATQADVSVRCDPLPAYLLRGHLRGDWRSAVTSIGFVELRDLLARPECVIADVLDPTDGQRLAAWRSYTCLMRAADHDGNAGTPRAWSGRSVVEPAPAGSQRVCRDTPDVTTTVNEEHPATYTLVSRSLQQQNFLLLAAGSCPDGTAPHQP